LVVQQVNKEWGCNKEAMDAYIMEVWKLENTFSGLEIHHVIRNNNVGANVLSKIHHVIRDNNVGANVLSKLGSTPS
jgi:nitrate reductase cytochrome c-type subunit